MQNLRIIEFNSIRDFGNMNQSEKFYPKGTKPNERKKLMIEHKKNFAGIFGINYKNIFMPYQKNTSTSDMYEDGFCYTLNKEDIKEYDDLYDYCVYADIIKLTKETPNYAIAHAAGDCAIVKAINMKTKEIVIAHCGGEYIDRYLPMQTIDALNCAEKNIKVFVSPFAYTLFYSNANNLKWANNDKVWENCKEYSEKNGTTSVKIDVYKALKKQLLDRKILENNLFISPYDIATCDLFYSNSRGYEDKSFAGRFLSGIAIIDNDIKINDSAYIKVIK